MATVRDAFLIGQLYSDLNMSDKRIVALIDMDCFYVQVHLEQEPVYKGRPSVVVQYQKSREKNPTTSTATTARESGGDGIIAVSYEARYKGVKRGEHRFLHQARKLCPELHAFQVAEKHGKASLTLYRDASKRVVNIMKRFCAHIERASIDECYLDLTQRAKEYHLPTDQEELANCWLSGEESIKASTAAIIARADDMSRATQLVADIRRAIYNELGFTCSAGISINKMAAKFIAGLKKPNAQSVLFPEQVDEYFKTVPIRKLRGLGGKLGAELCANFGVDLCGHVSNIGDQQLVAAFGQSEATFIRDMSNGRDEEPVKLRLAAESCGSGRNFLGRDKISQRSDLNRWVNSLLSDLYERLDEFKEDDGVVPKKLIVHLAWVRSFVLKYFQITPIM